MSIVIIKYCIALFNVKIEMVHKHQPWFLCLLICILSYTRYFYDENQFKY